MLKRPLRCVQIPAVVMQDCFMQVAISRRLIERRPLPTVNKAFTACVVAFNKFAVYLTASKDPDLSGGGARRRHSQATGTKSFIWAGEGGQRQQQVLPAMALQGG